jgi:PTS system mannose-specific IIA component
MIPCLVVTHGQLASELVAAAEMIVGEIEHIVPLCIGWQEDVNEARDEIERTLKNLHVEHGAIIMTDMFGGTPSNLAMSFLKDRKVEVITGVNLPMIIKAASQGESEDLVTLAEKICEKGKSNITIASRFLGES